MLQQSEGKVVKEDYIRYLLTLNSQELAAEILKIDASYTDETTSWEDKEEINNKYTMALAVGAYLYGEDEFVKTLDNTTT